MFESQEKHAKEVVPGLILGGIRDLDDILEMKPDVLVPLEWLPGKIWDKGFRGEILYYPIIDYGILPDDVLEKLVGEVLERLSAGKRVAVFCVGGHGRTGYVASCVLFCLGKKDPISFLRKNYNYSAEESVDQEWAVNLFRRRHAD